MIPTLKFLKFYANRFKSNQMGLPYLATHFFLFLLLVNTVKSVRSRGGDEHSDDSPSQKFRRSGSGRISSDEDNEDPQSATATAVAQSSRGKRGCV
jgi:hypothetical protein